MQGASPPYLRRLTESVLGFVSATRTDTLRLLHATRDRSVRQNHITAADQSEAIPWQSPGALLHDWPDSGAIVMDLTDVLAESAGDSVGTVMERSASEGRSVCFGGTIGRSGETRQATIATVLAIWALHEDWSDRLSIAWDIRFPRIPSSEVDPLTAVREGRAKLPSSPADRAQGEELAVWELRILREALSVRRSFSRTRKIIINLTYKCNNYCSFCAVGNRLHEDGDFEFHQQVLREHRAEGCDLVDFDGGEPTLYPNLLQIIRYARQLGYHQVNVTSNGRALSYPETAQKILNSGVTSLLISCHGSSAEVHDECVQVKGAFEQTMEGIRNVLRMKPSGLDFGVNITLTQDNWRELPTYFGLMDSLGVSKLNIQFLTPFGRTSEGSVPDPTEVAPVLAKLLDEYGSRIRAYLINVPFCFFPGYEGSVTGDVLKLERNMVFVTKERVNLFKYLAGTRRKTTQCNSCIFSVVCEGFYCFDEIWD